MLVNMHIKNLVLIDELDIDFSDGLNILTGETGAGKSIIVGSIGIGLGGKFPKELLRDEAKDGLVELVFSVPDTIIPQLNELEIDIEAGDEIIIQRKISGGRTVNRINDQTVTVSKIKEVAELLINLHAQHEQQTLLKPNKHLYIVDSFSSEIESIKETVREAFKNYTEADERLKELQKDSKDRIKKLDFLKYEINEIETAKLLVGEDEDLEALYKKIKNSKEIVASLSEAYELTGYDKSQSAGNQIGRAIMAIKQVTALDEETESLYSQLSDIEGLLNDFNRELSLYMGDMDFDEETFRETEARLDLINNLKAKYGYSIEEILKAREDFEKEYDELVNYDELIEELTHRKNENFNILKKESGRLTKEREKTASKLCKLVEDELKELNMNDVVFTMNFEEAPYSANGADKACFMIRTNIGEDIRPLHEAASGGELSRVMLAIKSCLAGSFDTPTLVFDEVDTGISGITAQRVARLMKKLGKTRQIISITHLPQIASYADSNYVIVKRVDSGKTVTSIERLDSDGVIREIARLLGGENITDNVLQSAREMKEIALRNGE